MPPGDVTVGPSSAVPNFLSGPLLLTEQPDGIPTTSTRQRMKSECLGWSLSFLQMSVASRILIPSSPRPISLPPSSHFSTLASCLQSAGSEGAHIGAGVGVCTSIFCEGTQRRSAGLIGSGPLPNWFVTLTPVTGTGCCVIREQ